MVSIEWFQRQAYVLHSSSCSGIGFGTLLHPHGVCHKCGCHKGPWSEPPRVRCSIWGTQWLPTGKAEQWSAVFPKWCILLFISVHASVHTRSLQSCLTLCAFTDIICKGWYIGKIKCYFIGYRLANIRVNIVFILLLYDEMRTLFWLTGRDPQAG